MKEKNNKNYVNHIFITTKVNKKEYANDIVLKDEICGFETFMRLQTCDVINPTYRE